MDSLSNYTQFLFVVCNHDNTYTVLQVCIGAVATKQWDIFKKDKSCAKPLNLHNHNIFVIDIDYKAIFTLYPFT